MLGQINISEDVAVIIEKQNGVFVNSEAGVYHEKADSVEDGKIVPLHWISKAEDELERKG